MHAIETANSAAGNSVYGIVCSGDTMPAATRGADGLSRTERIQRAISLLEEALQIIDDIGDCPEVGARLHGLIDELNDERSS